MWPWVVVLPSCLFIIPFVRCELLEASGCLFINLLIFEIVASRPTNIMLCVVVPFLTIVRQLSWGSTPYSLAVHVVCVGLGPIPRSRGHITWPLRANWEIFAGATRERMHLSVEYIQCTPEIAGSLELKNRENERKSWAPALCQVQRSGSEQVPASSSISITLR